MSQTVFAPWSDPGAKPLIEFRNVTKRFGDFTAIDGLSLGIYEKEFFALLGPSGCGKTTMMRMLAGFETPTEGSILLSGQDLGRVPPNRRAVNMMFQSYALFPHLSVWENIAFGLKREKQDKDAIDARVTEMLRLTRLEKFKSRKPHQISGGQRQRVALARSLAKAPKLLLLDEPLGALDRKLREETQFELMDIQEKTGTTFVIVTHDQEEAMTVASRVAVMDEGRLVQVATPPEIYEQPATTYVADFIGDVSLIAGRAKPAGERVEIAWAEGQPPIVATSETSLSTDQSVHFAIRPEKVHISKERDETRPNLLQGKVEDIAYLGNISTYHVRLSDGTLLKAQSTNHRRLANRGITWEDEVYLSFTETAGVVLTE
ncbi:ABC transporter ATP-binding protein [Roseivivax halodurans JCM 10272]|uniref:Spermidine/putrescine import ATP-binding protein PotA n=1 Tax=Roseivivax halodurans JCM 10272 TaxID=1449350 RepID=X7EG04_9RHOB|nr:ABC transporter ATP-binding protein [Roseivivax halodurans]ETX14805.1 ABC transporter ATP-binding protein [Roseivivax halodurans JCM 10272]